MYLTSGGKGNVGMAEEVPAGYSVWQLVTSLLIMKETSRSKIARNKKDLYLQAYNNNDFRIST